MKKLGILPQDTQLSPRDITIPAWDSVSEEEKKDWEDKMAIYAPMIDRMDQNIGRIRQKLKALGQDQNTVIMFLSDNGASHETITTTGFCRKFMKTARNQPVTPIHLPLTECGGRI